MLDLEQIKRELEETLAAIELEIDVVSGHAQYSGMRPEEMRNTDGNFTIIPLLAAQATVLDALFRVNLIGGVFNNVGLDEGSGVADSVGRGTVDTPTDEDRDWDRHCHPYSE